MAAPYDKPVISNDSPFTPPVHINAVADYAQAWGNFAKGDSTLRAAILASATEGQLFYDTTLKFTFQKLDGAWKPVMGRAYAAATKLSNTVLATGSGTKMTSFSQTSSGITVDPATGKFTAPFAARYEINFRAQWESNPNGERWTGFTVNGASIASETKRQLMPAAALELHTSAVTDEIALAAGDYVEFWLLHNVGASIGVRNYRATMSFVGPV